MTVTAAYQQGVTYPAATDRLVAGAGMWRKNDGSAHPIPTDGVIWDAYQNCAPTFYTGWQTKVGPGAVMVAGYRVTITAVETLTHDAATSTARWDLLIVRVKDTEAADGSNSATVEIVKGTTTADPSLPSTRCLIIGRVKIRASSSSLLSTDVNDARVYTSSAGGIVPAPNVATVTPPTLPVGAVIFDPVAGTHHRMTGAGAVPLSPIGCAIYTCLAQAIPDNIDWSPAAWTLHANRMGDISWVGVASPNTQGKLIIHPVTGLYAITYHLNSTSQYLNGSGTSWLSIEWTGSPMSYFRQGLPVFGSGGVSTTIIVGPSAETEIRFRCHLDGASSADTTVDHTACITRWA
jgi:hypothetical protein